MVVYSRAAMATAAVLRCPALPQRARLQPGQHKAVCSCASMATATVLQWPALAIQAFNANEENEGEGPPRCTPPPETRPQSRAKPTLIAIDEDGTEQMVRMRGHVLACMHARVPWACVRGCPCMRPFVFACARMCVRLYTCVDRVHMQAHRQLV